MSLMPMLFSDWWEELERPHRLWDQHFGTVIDPEDLSTDFDPFSANVFMYRSPITGKRSRRRYHPFLKNRRYGRGASTVQPDKNKFQATLDVSQFTPDEITVKVVDQNVIVEAKHDEKEDEHGWVSRQFVRKYIVPSQCDVDQVETHLSSDGILNIIAPRKESSRIESNERILKIRYTGKPALANCDEQEQQNDVSGEQQENQRGEQQQNQRGEQQQNQRGQQQQNPRGQQQQQQQPQRGRKGTVKAA